MSVLAFEGEFVHFNDAGNTAMGKMLDMLVESAIRDNLSTGIKHAWKQERVHRTESTQFYSSVSAAGGR